MSTSSELRVRELNRLKLALATFALHLDAFEERTHGLLRSFDRLQADELPGRKGDAHASQQGHLETSRARY